MSNTQLPTLREPDRGDPLGFGLKSIPEALQRWWLIGAGNPYFDDEVRIARPSLEIPKSGLSNAANFVDWVAKKRTRHGHSTETPFTLTINSQIMNDSESITRSHLRNTRWPIQDHELPGHCCSTDPLFSQAESLAIQFGIFQAEEEPGFAPIKAVVEYLLLDRWPYRRSLRGKSMVYGVDEIVVPYPGRWRRQQYKHESIGLDASKGHGGKLPLWNQWWKLGCEGKSIAAIAAIEVKTLDGFRTYEERMVRYGIDKIEEMMRPAEILNTP